MLLFSVSESDCEARADLALSTQLPVNAINQDDDFRPQGAGVLGHKEFRVLLEQYVCFDPLEQLSDSPQVLLSCW